MAGLTSTVVAAIARTSGPGSVVGTTPDLVVGAEIVAFLQAEGEGWKAMPAVTAVLRREGDFYVADAYSFKCRTSVRVATFSMSELVEATQ